MKHCNFNCERDSVTMHTTIEQELETHGHSYFQTVGDSMEPILHNRFSTVMIEKANEQPKLYDVVLYKRPPGVNASQPNGAYVLHRIVKVRKDDYLICGDNRYYKEPVPKEWILGVMKGYFNGDDYVDCEHDLQYLDYLKTLNGRYCTLWLKAFPVRIVNKIKKILKIQNFGL